jgi:hypothetical protein
VSTRKILEIGGIITAVVLIVFGVVALIKAIDGGNIVKDELSAQKIVGTPDMTPANITTSVKEAGLNPADLPIPTCSVAGEQINTGTKARCFAQYMNIHALEATGGVVYSEMPRYSSPDGKGTNDPTKAVQQGGKPVDNPARNIWISETAFATALNSSYMAEQTSLFGIVVGIALILAGLGFGILAVAGALRKPDAADSAPAKAETSVPEPTPAAGA